MLGKKQNRDAGPPSFLVVHVFWFSGKPRKPSKTKKTSKSTKRCLVSTPARGFKYIETKLSAGGSLPVYRCADRWICFLSSKPGKFRDNRGGVSCNPQNEIYEAPVTLCHTPQKKIFLRLRRACFDPYFYLYFTFVFTIICTFKKKFSSPAAGLFWPLVYLYFYLCF